MRYGDNPALKNLILVQIAVNKRYLAPIIGRVWNDLKNRLASPLSVCIDMSIPI
jgi:hypothetical protein